MAPRETGIGPFLAGLDGPEGPSGGGRGDGWPDTDPRREG